LSYFNSKSTRRFLVWKHVELTAICLHCTWVLGWIWNDCSVFIKLCGIIKPVDVHAETEKEIISNFTIKCSVCLNRLTWFRNVFQIGNQEYLHFNICVLIRQFIIAQHFNWTYSKFVYILTSTERIRSSLGVHLPNKYIFILDFCGIERLIYIVSRCRLNA